MQAQVQGSVGDIPVRIAGASLGQEPFRAPGFGCLGRSTGRQVRKVGDEPGGLSLSQSLWRYAGDIDTFLQDFYLLTQV